MLAYNSKHALIHNIKQIIVTNANKNIHPLFADIYVFNSHILHACMFKMIQSNHKGSSATGKRGREVSSGGKNKCNEAETECRQTEEAEQRRTDRERERV